MIKNEWKRLFIKNRFWVLFLGMVVLKFVLLLFDTHYINTEIEEYRDSYLEYLSSYTGVLTPEKDEELSARYSEFLEMSGTYTDLKKQYEAGEITSEEFSEKVGKISRILNNKDVIQLANEEYQYVKEAPDRRYILYTNGWEALLANERLDLAMVLFILFLSAYLFGYDSETDTGSIIFSTVHGKSGLFVARERLLIIMIVTVNAVLYLEEAVFFQFQYGLPQPASPIQSLPSFRNSPFHIRLYMACILMFVFQTLGAILLSQMTVFFADRCRKVWTAGIISGLFLFCPMACFNTETARYFFLPLGMLLGSGYLKGSCEAVMKNGVLISEPFTGISVPALMILLSITILGSGVFFLVTFRKNSVKGSRYACKKNVYATAAVITLTVCMLGIICAATHEETYSLKHTYSRGMGFSDTDYVYVNDEYGILQRINIEKHDNLYLIRDVMKEPYADKYYVDENYIYYTQKDIRSGMVSYYRIEKNSLKEELIFSEAKGMRQYDYGTKYLGLISKINLDNTSDSVLEKDEITDFWVDGKYLFTVDKDSVNMTDHTNGKTTELIHDMILTDCIAYDSGIVYYVNLSGAAYAYDIVNKQYRRLDMERCKRLFLCNSTLYFINTSDQIGKYDGKVELYPDIKVSDTSCLSASKDYIYFVDSENRVCRINLSTDQMEEIKTGTPAYNVKAFRDTDGIFVYQQAVPTQDFEWVFLDQNIF